MKYPSIDEMAKEVANRALDNFTYEGRTIREWAELIIRSESKITRRTQEETEAYVEGYNACFDRFCVLLQGDQMEPEAAIRQMKIYLLGVNRSMQKEGENK